MQIQGHDDEICNSDMRDVEHSIVLAAYESEGSRGDGGEEDDAHKAPNDVPVLNALC